MLVYSNRRSFQSAPSRDLRSADGSTSRSARHTRFAQHALGSEPAGPRGTPCLDTPEAPLLPHGALQLPASSASSRLGFHDAWNSLAKLDRSAYGAVENDFKLIQTYGSLHGNPPPKKGPADAAACASAQQRVDLYIAASSRLKRCLDTGMRRVDRATANLLTLGRLARGLDYFRTAERWHEKAAEVDLSSFDVCVDWNRLARGYQTLVDVPQLPGASFLPMDGVRLQQVARQLLLTGRIQEADRRFVESECLETCSVQQALKVTRGAVAARSFGLAAWRYSAAAGA